jgi:hypothetical protein
VRGSALSFDVARHEYRRPDGLVVPSVTRVLRGVGLSTDYEALAASNKLSRAILDRKRALGTAVHVETQYYDDHGLDLRRLDEEVLPYVEAWAMARVNLQLTPITRERRMYAEWLGVCGTLDGVFYRGTDDGHLILIDIKTGSVDGAATRYQTAGYEVLWNDEYPSRPIAERWAVELTPERATPYRIHDFTKACGGWRDGHHFRSIVQAYYALARGDR